MQQQSSKSAPAERLERIQQQMTSRTERKAGHGLDYSRRRGMQESLSGLKTARPGGWRRRQRGAASVMYLLGDVGEVQ